MLTRFLEELSVILDLIAVQPRRVSQHAVGIAGNRARLRNRDANVETTSSVFERAFISKRTFANSRWSRWMLTGSVELSAEDISNDGCSSANEYNKEARDASNVCPAKSSAAIVYTLLKTA